MLTSFIHFFDLKKSVIWLCFYSFVSPFFCKWRLFFKAPLHYFSISSETTLDRNSNSFATFSWRFGLVLPPYFVFVRQPEVTGKPEVNRKTVRTARWCDIWFFSNMPYPDVKPWYYTRNDVFNLILKSDFD